MTAVVRRSFRTSACLWSRQRQKHYDILQTHPTADKKTIKAQYYRLSKRFHPDLNPNNEEAHHKFLQVNEAYAVLGNEAARRAYDAELDSHRHSSWQGSGFRPNTGPSASWHARARRAGNTGSASARAQAEDMRHQTHPFNHREHYERHYQAEELRRQKRVAAAARRRKAAGTDPTEETHHASARRTAWSRLWRIGVVLSGIGLVAQQWHQHYTY